MAKAEQEVRERSQEGIAISGSADLLCPGPGTSALTCLPPACLGSACRLAESPQAAFMVLPFVPAAAGRASGRPVSLQPSSASFLPYRDSLLQVGSLVFWKEKKKKIYCLSFL